MLGHWNSGITAIILDCFGLTISSSVLDSRNEVDDRVLGNIQICEREKGPRGTLWWKVRRLEDRVGGQERWKFAEVTGGFQEGEFMCCWKCVTAEDWWMSLEKPWFVEHRVSQMEGVNERAGGRSRLWFNSEMFPACSWFEHLFFSKLALFTEAAKSLRSGA